MNNYFNAHLNIYLRLFFIKKNKVCPSVLRAAKTESSYTLQIILFCDDEHMRQGNCVNVLAGKQFLILGPSEI